MKWGEKASVIGPSPANPAIDGWLYIRQAENIWSLDKGGNDKWILVSRGEEGRGREVGRGGGVKGREEGEMNWEVELWATHGDRDRGTTVLVGLAVGGGEDGKGCYERRAETREGWRQLSYRWRVTTDY